MMDEFLEQLIPTGIRIVERTMVRTVRFLIGRTRKREQDYRAVKPKPGLDPITREMHAEMHERMVFSLKHVVGMVKSSELEEVGKTMCPYGRGWSWGSTSDDRIVATCLVPCDAMTPEQADEVDKPRNAARAKIKEALDELDSAKERGDDAAIAAASKRWREAELQYRKCVKSGWTAKQYSMDEIEAAWQRIPPSQRPLPPLTEVRKAASFQRIMKWRERRHKDRIKYLRENATDIGPPAGESDTPAEAAELKRLIPLQVTEPAVAAVGRMIYPEGRDWWLVEKGRGAETAYEATCLVPRDGMTPEQADAADRRANLRVPRGLYVPIGWEPRVVPFIDMVKAWERMPEEDRPYADWDGDRSKFRWGVDHPADIVRRTLKQIGRNSDIPAFDDWFEAQMGQ